MENLERNYFIDILAFEPGKLRPGGMVTGQIDTCITAEHSHKWNLCNSEGLPGQG